MTYVSSVRNSSFFLCIAGTVMASNKTHNYDDNYLDFGFTGITDKGVVKPVCDLSQNTHS